MWIGRFIFTWSVKWVIYSAWNEIWPPAVKRESAIYFSWSVNWVIYFPWNVICPPAVSRDSWRNAHKKHCFCTPTAYSDIWGTRISKFSWWEHALGPPSKECFHVRVNPHFGTRTAVRFNAAPNLQYLNVKFSFESWIFVIYSLPLLHLLYWPWTVKRTIFSSWNVINTPFTTLW